MCQTNLLLVAFTLCLTAAVPVNRTLQAASGPFSTEPNTFIKPVRSSRKAAALIWIQGAATRASAYKPLLQGIQTSSELSLWIGMPSFLGDTPEPARLNANIQDTLSMMWEAGLAKDTPLYFGAHSLGTVFLQTWCTSNHDICKGLILTGGCIARSNYYPKFEFAVPTLTMGGSLDGLARATRTIAESYYNQITVGGEADKFPVVVIDGMNHYSWGSGVVTATEKQRDLKAEITLDEAHAQGAALAADWLSKLSGAGGGSSVAEGVKRTGLWVQPLIAAYNLEGSRHFNSPRQIGGPGEKECIQGGCPDHSPWAIEAQKVIASGLDGWTFQATNSFVDCKSTPITGEVFHLPKISNNTSTRTISDTTYSQCSWALGDKADTGFVYTSASEIGTKMSSRQCLMILGEGKVETPFSVDDPDFCKMANVKAYQWALTQADAKTKARYEKYGQAFTFGPDIQKSGGPLFLDAGITYKDNGNNGVEISSPTQKTEIDYWKKHFHIPRPKSVPDPGCFHYCKLLSPARAMEWIYVDGLRRNYGI